MGDNAVVGHKASKRAVINNECGSLTFVETNTSEFNIQRCTLAMEVYILFGVIGPVHKEFKTFSTSF